MNPCNDIRALLPLVVGGDLEEDQARAVSEHLSGGCAACAVALRELERLRGLLCELPVRSPAPAVDLWPDLRAALVAEGLVRRGPLVVRRARVGVRGMGLSAAAATLLVAGAVWSLRSQGEVPVAPSGTPELAESSVTPGVAPDLAPILVGGPTAGGLRPLAPGEEPFSLEAELFGVGVGASPLAPRGSPLDPARPSLAGERGN